MSSMECVCTIYKQPIRANLRRAKTMRHARELMRLTMNAPARTAIPEQTVKVCIHFSIVYFSSYCNLAALANMPPNPTV